ncbi:MAG: M50 family metallopeptidase [Oscillospiraceae bacterium]|nr:M50 family metallopeptidase [Oscillospiraceae bacterium]
MRLGRVTVTGGFVLVWGIMVYLDAGRIAALCLLTALLHEAGHLLFLLLCGGRLRSAELNASGAVIRTQPGQLSYKREIACVLAGPAASLAAALLFALGGDRINFAFAPARDGLAGLCLLQGAFNLLPARGLDGGRALRLMLEHRQSPRTETVVRWATLIAVWAAAAFTAAAFALGGYSPAALMIGALAVLSMIGTED